MQSGTPEWQQPSNHARHDLTDHEGSLDAALHLSRYSWTRSRFCRPGSRVLDLGCGTGFGASCLAAVAQHVTGVDFSEDGLATARDLHAEANVAFHRADLTDPSLASHFGPASFDLVTSMETIEHLDDYFTFIASVGQLLAPGGVFVLGTPNRRMTYEHYPDRRHMDASHVQEFTLVALEHCLRDVFDDVEIYFQVIPGYWDPPDAPSSPRSERVQRLRGWVPPRILPAVAALLAKTGLTGLRSSRSWSADEVVFFEATSNPMMESVAFSLMAVCRNPIPRIRSGPGVTGHDDEQI